MHIFLTDILEKQTIWTSK